MPQLCPRLLGSYLLLWLADLTLACCGWHCVLMIIFPV